MNNYIKLILPLIVLVISLNIVYGGSNVIQYIDQPGLNEEQHHYYISESNNPLHEEILFIHIDIDAFLENEISLNIYNYNYTFVRKDGSRLLDPNRRSWIGKIPGSLADYAHFVINKKMDIVVGHITIDGLIYVIRPLTGGLHLLASVNPANATECSAGKEHISGPDKDGTPELPLTNPDIINNIELENNRATGECNIRVLVVYTDDADAALAGILSDINNLFNIANTGYQNSGLPTRIELAACYREVYAEVDLDTSLDDITFSGGSNSEFDDVFTQRGLWDADQVALIMSGGGGLAWVNIAENRQFSVTGINNFGVFTFHHELGHNHECTHDLVNSSQPGTAPYAGWGEPTTGCFRTIMAYGEACGTGPCPRHNVFSDNTGTWSCGGSTYAKGTINNRNTDRIAISDGTIMDYEIVPIDNHFVGDYDWFSGESVHRAGQNTCSYNSASNNFEFFNGSEGSFRASESVTLGEGFWARSGSDFTAYLESCTPNFMPGEDEEVTEQYKVPELIEGSNSRIKIAPNPFSGSTNINYLIDDESLVSVMVYNLQGDLVSMLLDNTVQDKGNYTLQFDGSGFAASTYICIIKIDQHVYKKNIVLSR